MLVRWDCLCQPMPNKCTIRSTYVAPRGKMAEKATSKMNHAQRCCHDKSTLNVLSTESRSMIPAKQQQHAVPLKARCWDESLRRPRDRGSPCLCS
mmetsp:Transcript_9312/g.23167  ORF Transcript_9312/g.23167 Transcript_9312/m.23167 type:complete len:95 (-) Transcript_9312:704-988(-)